MSSSARQQVERDKILLEVEAELLNLTTEGLEEVAAGIGIRLGRVKNKSRLIIMREIRSQIEKAQTVTFLQSVKDHIKVGRSPLDRFFYFKKYAYLSLPSLSNDQGHNIRIPQGTL
jgi:hypothetical protein